MSTLAKTMSVVVRRAPGMRFGWAWRSIRPVLVLVCALGVAVGGLGQGILVDGGISGVSAGAGSYNYTITLNNESGSGSSLETFWYSWVPGQNYLPSSPTSVQPPAGWADSIFNFGSSDGYSIQFTTTSAALAPGGSLSFGFTSPDSPAAVVGNSPHHPGIPVGTSYVYSGLVAGNSTQFVVQNVPEPSPVTLLVGGAVGLWVARRGRWVA